MKVLPELATPDVQALFAHGSYSPRRAGAGHDAGHDLRHVADASTEPWLRRGALAAAARTSRTSTRATSAMRPTAAPRWAGCAGSAGCSRRRHWRNTSWRRQCPGADVKSDDELLHYVKQTGGTAFHATCTCKMGRDMLAVVDDRLRVHGLERLRVIDASVMPAVTSTNTNAPTIMIAEKGASMVREDARIAKAA